jgi:hypothetical protein
MLISKWVESKLSKGVWSSENCVEGTVMIIGRQESFFFEGDHFSIFDPNGMSLDVGMAFPTFEDAAKRLESIFTWEFKLSKSLL